MKLVKFAIGTRVGVRCYRDGETASIPSANADALILRGAAVAWPPPVVPPPFPGPVDVPENGDDDEVIAPGPVAEIVTKPAEPEVTKASPTLSKRALKKLFGRKGV